MPDRCFCEAIRDGMVRQPANAISSLSFAFVGCLVLLSDAAATRGLRGYAVLYAAALIVVGLGSAFYHASLSFIGQFADVMGMYLIATFIILYSFGGLRSLSTAAIVATYTVANLALALILFGVPSVRRYLFAVVLIAGLVVEYIARCRAARRLDGRLLAAGLVALLAGFGVWVLDITHAACAPHSPLQGHALWHFAGAFASWKLYAYYRSDRRPDVSCSPGGRP